MMTGCSYLAEFSQLLSEMLLKFTYQTPNPERGCCSVYRVSVLATLSYQAASMCIGV